VEDFKSRAGATAGLISLSLVAGIACGQDGPAPAQGGSQPAGGAAELQEVIVTGYRRSLTESTAAKREATGFIDQINAEDIGKFPDTNIAESFNRVPGITITRDIDGEGTDISIRGLGTNFTKVLLNGAPVAVASTGITDAQNQNREVDLDLFPAELFTQLHNRVRSEQDGQYQTAGESQRHGADGSATTRSMPATTAGLPAFGTGWIPMSLASNPYTLTLSNTGTVKCCLKDGPCAMNRASILGSLLS
jgi:TonB-dependent Receptor Plug Domain